MKCYRCEKEIQWDDRMYVVNLIDSPHTPFCRECFEVHILPEMEMSGAEYMGLVNGAGKTRENL